MIKEKVLPFSLLYLDKIPFSKRGYAEYPSFISYDPITQIVTFSTQNTGPTEPTTMSPVESTGFMNRDSDEANDDKGTD